MLSNKPLGVCQQKTICLFTDIVGPTGLQHQIIIKIELMSENGHHTLKGSFLSEEEYIENMSLLNDVCIKERLSPDIIGQYSLLAHTWDGLRPMNDIELAWYNEVDKYDYGRNILCERPFIIDFFKVFETLTKFISKTNKGEKYCKIYTLYVNSLKTGDYHSDGSMKLSNAVETLVSELKEKGIEIYIPKQQRVD